MSAAKELQTVQNQSITITPMDMLQTAVQQGADLDKLQQLMDLQDRWEKAEARKAYIAAMAAFKANAPSVKRDKKNKQYDSMYVSLPQLVSVLTPELSRYGLSYRWDIDQSNGIKVSCVMTHDKGHSEAVSMSAPPDTSGAKNPIQQIKSTITYLKAVTLESITGLASTDANLDDDGNGSGGDTITEEQVANLQALIEEVGANKAGFLRAMNVTSLDQIPEKLYQRGVKALEAKRGQK